MIKIKSSMKLLNWVLICLIFSGGNSVAQEFKAIDYSLIENQISNADSEFYYPQLIKRYEKGDTTLTLDNYRHLYYGFTFQDKYRPYDRNPLNKEISQLMTTMNEDTLPMLQEKAKAFLARNPFSLKMIYYLQNFNAAAKETEKNKILDRQFNGIVQAILSSGDGKSLHTAYSVNHPSDEYMVMSSLDLSPKSNQINSNYDYFQLKNNNAGIKELYFDVDRMATVGTKQMGIKTIQVENEEVPEDGVLIGTEKEMKQYIPLGYQTLFQKQIDLDEDGDKDWLIVTKLIGEESVSNFAKGRPELRELIILERKDNKQLETVVTTKKAIPCIDCGGDKDPFIDIKIAPKQFTIFTKGGGMFIWERETTFELKKDIWMLSKEKFNSYRNGNEENKQSDVETSDDFGEVLLTEFNYYDLLD